ncbi:MAG: GAF domain-containing protein [Acidobacteriia bacterium]|nr:GAF domain-containing protein [Terriglobia bacterium]
MDMDIEGKIRSRIEAILINDAKNYAEMKMMASQEEPLEDDPFAEERNLYQRIINNYRNAVSEVNGLLEENVGFLSGLCRIVESIREKEDFQEICSQIVDCVLQDLGAEFCSLVFRSRDEWEGGPLYFEGIREQQKFLFSHSHATLLGSPEFARVVAGLADEGADYLNIGDVYREARFNTVDFPSVVRSLVCLPIVVHDRPLGALILSHSLPHFFNHNHTRVLKILASTVAHLWLLTARRNRHVEALHEPRPQPSAEENEGVLSVVLLNFESDGSARRMLADREMIKSIRSSLSSSLEGKESIMSYDDTGLLVLLSGTPEGRVSERAAGLRAAFERWKVVQGEKARSLQMNFGYATCESGEALTRTLEVASQMMHSDPDENGLSPAVPDSKLH